MRRSAQNAGERTCPVCGEPDARPILYGLPTAAAAEDPEVVIGGCMIWDDSPAYRCRNPRCGHRFGRG